MSATTAQSHATGLIDPVRRQMLKLGAYIAGGAAAGFAVPDCSWAASQAPVKKSLSIKGIAKITEVFNQLLAKNYHPGAQLAVYRDGELVLELMGGNTEADGKTPVTANTLFQIRSTTKALTTMAMMQAYERGRFKFDDPVAKHWPGSAAKGKGKITLGQVMSHRAGIPDGPMIPPWQFNQRETVAKAVASMKPIWEPGSKNGYHAATIGWVCDELLFRWEGKSMQELLKHDFIDPLGLKNLYVGLPLEQFPRMAKMDVRDDVRELQGERARFSDFLNTPAGIALPLAWVAGVSTARDLGRLMCVLAGDGVLEGRSYFKPETLALVSKPTNAEGEIDQRLMASVRWGLGFLLGAERSSFSTQPHNRAVGHSGGGASVGWADPEQRLAVAFLCNRMLGRESGKRTRMIGDAIYDALV